MIQESRNVSLPLGGGSIPAPNMIYLDPYSLSHFSVPNDYDLIFLILLLPLFPVPKISPIDHHDHHPRCTLGVIRPVQSTAF